jgi:hypothetical protein
MNRPVKVTADGQAIHDWFDELAEQRADWPEERRREVKILLEEMLDEDTLNLILICNEMLERAVK